MKAMKRMDVLCTSPSSTAVCMSLEHRSVVRQSTRVLERTRLLERQGSRVSEPNTIVDRARTRDLHHHRNREHSQDQKPQKSSHRSSHHNSASKNKLADRPLEQELSTAIPVKSSVAKPQSSSSNEVVVMRVSLHCQGCAGKVRKHLSKMEGVTSFNIDLEKQRVTVVGDVSPVGVLESISKVKNAELWPTSNKV
eukprot:Gb_05090 [translate_table: standard]